MAIYEVTSRQFRDKQKDIFDLADKGEKIIIRRGKKQAYTLIPIDEVILYFELKMLVMIDRDMTQVREGKVKKISSLEELDKFLGL